MTTTNNPDTDNVIEVYVHTEGVMDLQVLSVSRDGHVRDLLAPDESGASVDSVWLSDQGEPLDIDCPLIDAGVTDKCHVHRGLCASVKARVRHHDQSLDEAFPPTTQVARVYRWAAGPDGFKLPNEQIPKHGLIVRGGKEIVDPEVHLGSLVTSDRCDVDLDLVPRKRFEG